MPRSEAEYDRKVLEAIASGRHVTQRSLSSDLGVALGMSNLLMRRLVKKGWVRVSNVSPRRVRYLITPAGIAAKARLTRQYFLSSLAFYRDCREHVSSRFALLAGELRDDGVDPQGPSDVVFYGAGEVAEVAYICLQETRLRLLGVVDEVPSKRLLDHPVHGPDALSGRTLDGRPYAMLVVMPSDDENRVRRTLTLREVPLDRVFWL
jgi:hypothetical protein